MLQLFSLCVLLACPATPQAEPPLPDPGEILARMADELEAAPYLAYRARSEGTGAATAWPSFEGEVHVARSVGELAVPGRIALHGTGSYPGREHPVRTEAAFDGRTVRWLRRGSQELVERSFLPAGPRPDDWAEVTRHFGRPGSELILFAALGGAPLLRAGDVVEYEGSILADDVLCDLVFVEHDGERSGWTRWLVGRDDGLPRRREEGWIGADGKAAATITRYSDWRIGDDAPADAFALTIPAGFAAVPWEPPTEDVTPLLAAGTDAPGFTLRDPAGREVRLADLRGSVVLIDFWSTTCAPCLRAMAHAQGLYEEHADDGLVVLSIDAFEQPGDPDPVPLFERLGLSYRLLLDGDAVASTYRVTVLPTLYLIDRQGRIAHGYRGFADALADGIDQRVAALLAR